MQALYGAAVGHPNQDVIERNVKRIQEALRAARGGAGSPEPLWALVTQWREAAEYCRTRPVREEIALLWDRVADELKAVLEGGAVQAERPRAPDLQASHDGTTFEMAEAHFRSYVSGPGEVAHRAILLALQGAPTEETKRES